MKKFHQLVALFVVFCSLSSSSVAWPEEIVHIFNKDGAVDQVRKDIAPRLEVATGGATYTRSLYLTIGDPQALNSFSIFAVPVSGTVLTVGDGSVVELWCYQYVNGDYLWQQFSDFGNLPSGSYVIVKGNKYSQSNIKQFDATLRIPVEPDHFLYQYFERHQDRFCRDFLVPIESQNILPSEDGATYNVAYLGNLTTMSVSRIAEIDGSAIRCLDGIQRRNKLLAVVLPGAIGNLETVLTADQAKANQLELRDGQIFGLVLEIVPDIIPQP
ncbi:MAG: hypothetical protein WAV73_04585 [Candidatus Moraniibacteriota bacterium]